MLMESLSLDCTEMVSGSAASRGSVSLSFDW